MLSRFEKYRFPLHLTPEIKAYFASRSQQESPERRKAFRTLEGRHGPAFEKALSRVESNPRFAAKLRTTCVATLIQGGTRANSLPTEAKATINCRMLPHDHLEDLQKQVAAAIHDPFIELKRQEKVNFAPFSPTQNGAVQSIQAIVNQMWQGIPVVPVISTGVTDARFLRQRGIHTYGILPFPVSESDINRFHGIDERIPVASIEKGVDFLQKLVLEINRR